MSLTWPLPKRKFVHECINNFKSIPPIIDVQHFRFLILIIKHSQNIIYDHPKSNIRLHVSTISLQFYNILCNNGKQKKLCAKFFLSVKSKSIKSFSLKIIAIKPLVLWIELGWLQCHKPNSWFKVNCVFVLQIYVSEVIVTTCGGHNLPLKYKAYNFQVQQHVVERKSLSYCNPT